MRNYQRAPEDIQDDRDHSLRISLPHRRESVRLKTWAPAQRGETHTPEFAGVALPSSTGSTADGAVHILCLAPGEWLAVFDAGDVLEEHLRVWNQTRAAGGVAAVTVSDASVVIRIQGPQSRAVLSRGCGLDFHPTSFKPATCARTLFAKSTLIVDCVGPECFDLYLGRSYQAYLHAWLTDAALSAALES
jgi:sarcosine oxidase, subunit gamma